MIIELTDEQVNILKMLLVQLMANQINTNGQSILTNSQNCIFFLTKLEKVPEVELKEIIKQPENNHQKNKKTTP